MNARRAAGAGLAAISLAGGAMCGWAGAPLWLSVLMLAAGAFVALRPFGRPPAAEQIDALQQRLTDARSGPQLPGANGETVSAVVTPCYIAFPLPDGVRLGPVTMRRRSMLLRDEVPAAQWHLLAALLRMQSAPVATGGNVLARFIDSSLAKPKQL